MAVHRTQPGTFDSQAQAQACSEQLAAEGCSRLSPNVVGVHSRVQDWQWNR